MDYENGILTQKRFLGESDLKKRLFIIVGIILVLLIAGLVLAGNYFYSESVKRGEEVELYSGDEDPAKEEEMIASEEDQEILAEAQSWFNHQELTTLEQTSYDDLKLKAQFLPNDKETHKAVILAHGYRKESNDMGDLVKYYHDKGFDVLIPDARGHGESEGDYIGYGWHDRFDYLDWIDMLIDDYEEESIILHGNSMGATLVLMTSGEDLPDEVKGVIADSGYTTVKEELTHQLKHLYNLPAFPILDITSGITKLRAGYTFGEASAIDQVKGNTRPLMIIHGEEDELVPTEMAHELYDTADSEKRLWLVPEAGHIEAYKVATKEFENRVSDFLDEALAE